MPSANEGQTYVEPLTSRELDVMVYVDRGMDAPEVAAAMGLAINTIRFHLRNIYSKFGVCCLEDALSVHRSRGRAAQRANEVRPINCS